MAMRIFFALPGTKIPATYTTQYTKLNTRVIYLAGNK